MKVALFIAMFLVAGVAPAQDLLDEMAQATCSCLESKDFSQGFEKLKLEAGLCILNYYQGHVEEVNAFFGIDAFNAETGRMIGEKLGIKMTGICPDLVIRLGQSKIDSGDGDDEDDPTYEISGKVVKMDEGDFITYHIKADDGKTYKVLWYQNFAGSEDLVDNPKKLVGKNVRIDVADVECYVPKAKGYYSVKEIRKLKK